MNLKNLDEGIFSTFNGVTSFHPRTELAGEYCASDRDIYKFELHNNIKAIADYAASGNPNLKDVIIPDSVQYIGKSFVSTGINTIIFEGKTPPEIDDGAFSNSNVQRVFVPSDSIEVYKEYFKSKPDLLDSFANKDLNELVRPFKSLDYIYQIPTLTKYLQHEKRVREFNQMFTPIGNQVKRALMENTSTVSFRDVNKYVLDATEEVFDKYVRDVYSYADTKSDVITSFMNSFNDDTVLKLYNIAMNTITVEQKRERELQREQKELEKEVPKKSVGMKL